MNQMLLLLCYPKAQHLSHNEFSAVGKLIVNPFLIQYVFKSMNIYSCHHCVGLLHGAVSIGV